MAANGVPKTAGAMVRKTKLAAVVNVCDGPKRKAAEGAGFERGSRPAYTFYERADESVSRGPAVVAG